MAICCMEHGVLVAYLVTAQSVELSMWQYSVEAFIFLVWPYLTLSLRAW